MHVCRVIPIQDTVRTRDGFYIELSVYLPPGESGRVLVIGPGAGIEQVQYQSFAAYCSQQGCTAITFDYRGTGRSGPGIPKDYEATLRQWANQDLDAVLLYAKKRFPNQEIVFLGHCISGEIVGLAPASEYIDQLIMVGSSLACWRLWPRSSQPRIALMKIASPLISKCFGYFPGKRLGFLGDLPLGVMREISDWCERPNGVFDVFPDNNFQKLNIPILALSFSDDWFTPPKAVSALLDHFSAAQKEWLHLRPADLGIAQIGHSGFFDQANKQLWQFTLEWITAPKTIKGYFF